MPLDPTIPLGITPQASTTANPLDMIGKFATIQNSLNQAKLFQQTFAARQLAGQIMSSAPDMETGFQQIMKSEAAPFVGAYISQARQSQLTQLEMEEKKQNMGESALSYINKMALPSALNNPISLDSNSLAGLRLMAPSVQKQVLASLNDQRQGLYAGLPDDTSKWTNADLSKYRQNVVALSMATGTTADTIHEVVGQPKMENVGNRIQPGVQLPAAQGGGFVASGGGLGIGTTPSYQQGPEGIPTPTPGLGPDGRPTGPMPGVTATEGATAGGNALGAQGPSPVGATAPPSTGISPNVSGLGTPINAPRVPLPPGMQTPFGMTADALSTTNDLNKKYDTEGAKKYDSATTTLGSLRMMNHDLDVLASTSKGSSGPGFLNPGAPFVELRKSIATGMNGLSQMFNPGEKLPFDPEKVAAAEEWAKESPRMTLMVTNQFLGGSREAAQTIEGIAKSVPSLENSYLGAKFLINTLNNVSQREIDHYNWNADWRSKNRTLINADVEFNKQFPITSYVDKAIEQTGFGLTKNGFASKEDVRKAFQAGYLTDKQAEKIMQTQFGMK